MVKKTKLRPRRLFYDKSKNKYYYLIEGKKTFIKTGDVSQKQLVKINIKNVIPRLVKAKRRRQAVETTLITNSKKVAPTLLAPISANLTPNINLYKLKDSEKLGEKITSLEKKIELLSDTSKTTLPKPTTTTPEKTKTNIGVDAIRIAIRQGISEGVDTYSDFVKWFENNGSNVIALGSTRKTYDDYSISSKNNTKFSQIFNNELNAFISKSQPAPEEKKPASEEKKPTPEEKKPTYADKVRETAKNIAKALSPRSARVAPTPDEDNPVDAGDINVSAGVAESKVAGRGKEHENDNDGIYNDELEQIFYDKLHKFVPVISSDEMDIIEKMVDKDTEKMGWIQNTDPKNSMGRHWVAYFINIPEGEINYYDSLVENNGMPPPESMKGLKKIVDKINPEFYLKFKNNLCRYQNPKSNNCGYFSLKFLLDRYNNIPFRECSGYDKVQEKFGEGEKMIQKFKRFL